MSGSPRLTCHVLDASRGRPAAGVAVTLSRLDDDDVARVVATATTNDDGRTDAPLLTGDGFRPGRYELAFAVGDHFAGREGVGSPPYLDVVPVCFGMAAGTGDLHVALLVTPWSYTTYRGS